MRSVIMIMALAMVTAAANGAVVVNTSQGGALGDLNQTISGGDLIQGLIATELPGDLGWHPANAPPGADDPEDRLPAFTDGQEVRASGLTGLLNDFPGAGTPTKRIQYNLGAAADVAAINVFSGNNGRDGRVFHTYTVEFSANGSAWTAPIYVQSHASGTVNNASTNWRNVLTELSDNAGALATGVSHIRFDFYAVDNTQGEMWDPFDGINPFTGANDALTAPIASPLVWEIDVIAVPEPAALALLGLGGLMLRRRRTA